MKFSDPGASMFVPDGVPAAAALRRITHLGIGAHPDDLEIMALHGILRCHRRTDAWFGAVVCTTGAGSPRSGAYAGLSDAGMADLRRREQEKAAAIGGYGLLVQLHHSSAAVKDPAGAVLESDLAALFAACRPSVVYTHNPADAHETHVAVAAAVLRALRALRADRRPERVLGCEAWRSLDWLTEADRVALDVGEDDELAAALVGAFASQIAGGKRYDLAVPGRRRANATFGHAHAADTAEQVWFALDLTPLIRDPGLDAAGWVLGRVDAFRRDVSEKLGRYLPPVR